MRTIDDNDRKIHSVMDVVHELSTTPKIIIDTASKLKSFFLIKIPDNTEIYLRDSYKKTLLSRWGDMATIFDFNRNERTFRVDSNIVFLCLEPLDYESIIPMGHIQQKEFNSVALRENNFDITILNAAGYTTRHSITNFNGTFDSFHKEKSIPLLPPKNPTHEKIIEIKFSDLFITPENLQAIRKELSSEGPIYGNFKTEEWTSTMLAQLNEASTLFLASPKPNSTSNEIIKEIEIWLRERWGREDAGDILVKEAAKAIFPDMKNESEVKISDHILGVRNDYTSTTLTIINEAAFHNWKEMKSKDGKYKQDKALTDLLQEKYKLKGRLTKAVSTIIRPDENKRIKMTSPY